MKRSAPNWPEFLWHYRVHRDRVGEHLFFLRLSFAPVYDRDFVERCAIHGVRSEVSYEMFGGYDVLLRIWLPTA